MRVKQSFRFGFVVFLLTVAALERVQDAVGQTTQPQSIERVANLPLISLKTVGTTAREAFEMLGGSVGASISPIGHRNGSGGIPATRFDLWAELTSPRIDFDLESMSFWQSFDRLGLKAGLRLMEGRDCWMELGPDDIEMLKPIAVSDSPLARVRIPAFSGKSAFRLEFRVDPRVSVLDFGQPVVESASDPQGQVLQIHGDGTPRIDQYTAWSDFRMLDSNNTGLSKLRGYLPVRIITRSQKLEMPLQVGATGRAGNWDVEIIGVRRVAPHTVNGFGVPSQTHISFLLKPVGGAVLPESLKYIVHLTDVTGSPLASNTTDKPKLERPGIFRQECGVWWQRRDGASAAPSKLIINVPLETKNVSIPFEFKDVRFH